MPAVEVWGLCKRYDDKEVLHGISFSIPHGQVCGYLGPNGAGKSTTIRVLAAMLRPDAGTVRIAGHDVTDSPLAVKRAIGYVPESGALYGLLSPREHLHLLADLYDLPTELATQRIEDALDHFELKSIANRRIDTLSKGQKQRTVIAAALLHDPEVLLLDEPLNGLDVSAQLKVKDTLRSFAHRGRTILFCSHTLDVVERLCDRAIILDQGRVVADASTSDLLKRSKDATLESIFQTLVKSDDSNKTVASDG